MKSFTDPKNKEKEKIAGNNYPAPKEKQKQSDPPLTELDGLKKGGVEPVVNPEDKEIPEEK